METQRHALWLIISLITLLPAPSMGQATRSEATPDAYREFVRANQLASAGAITRSIPHYENVIRLAGERYPLAHFNLAEVHRLKGDCKDAVVLYQAYMALADDPEIVGEAKEGIRECRGAAKWSKLTVKVSPIENSQVLINGYILAKGRSIEGLELLPGEYRVEVSAVDHYMQASTVTLEAETSQEVEAALKKQIFYGHVTLNVDQADANISITPREVDSPDAPTKPMTLTSPHDEGLKLATGKYFIEITKEDFHPWIRNVSVRRDETSEVNVTMGAMLPREIR